MLLPSPTVTPRTALTWAGVRKEQAFAGAAYATRTAKSVEKQKTPIARLLKRIESIKASFVNYLNLD
jgi:hypothetical protein